MESYTWRFLLRHAANQALNWVFPPQQGTCLLCQRPMYEETRLEKSATASGLDPVGICFFCLQDAAQGAGQVRSAAVAVGGRTVRVISAMPYEGLARSAIRKWKYDGVLALTNWFGRELASSCRRDVTFSDVDCVTPVPTTPDRLRKRGYHHVGLLGAVLARDLQVPLVNGLVRHAKSGEFTQSQTAKSVAQRRKSLVGVFAMRPQVEVSGKHVLLVDDVVTTGATVEACARVLFCAGAKAVTCAAIARVSSVSEHSRGQKDK